jgi:glycosyltransferase involved in cell wall biosynthesis
MISVFIPVFNEEKNIENAVNGVLKAAKTAENTKVEIIIVDDASTDKTPLILKKLEKRYPFVRIIRNDVNSGIGEGVKKAIKIASYPKFMIVPGDNDASPLLLTKLFRNRNKAQLLLSYYLNKELRGRFRTLLSAVYGLIYMMTFGIFIQYFNGVALYPTDKIRKLDLKAKRFSITAELNTKLLCSGCTYHEISGFMQTGIGQSKSIRLNNVIETAITYLGLIYEIKWSQRDLFDKKPLRVRE